MNIYELIAARQSDRAYDAARAVEPEKIARIVEAARLAPSACNAQPWHFVVVTDPALRDKVADTTSSKVLGINHFTKQAPVHIVVVEESANASSAFGSWVKQKDFKQIDIGIATAHITLAATHEGLGSCILGWFDEKALRKLLGIPASKRILLDIVLGYTTQEPRAKKRKETKEIMNTNRY